MPTGLTTESVAIYRIPAGTRYLVVRDKGTLAETFVSADLLEHLPDHVLVVCDDGRASVYVDFRALAKEPEYVRADEIERSIHHE